MNLTEKRSSSNLLNGLLANLLIWQATDFPVLRRALVSGLEIRWPWATNTFLQASLATRGSLWATESTAKRNSYSISKYCKKSSSQQNRSQPFNLSAFCMPPQPAEKHGSGQSQNSTSPGCYVSLPSEPNISIWCSSKAKGNVAGDAVICYMLCQPCMFFSTETCTAFYSTQ